MCFYAYSCIVDHNPDRLTLLFSIVCKIKSAEESEMHRQQGVHFVVFCAFLTLRISGDVGLSSSTPEGLSGSNTGSG